MDWYDEVDKETIFNKLIKAVAPKLSEEETKEWANAFYEACQKFNIADKDEIAQLLAQCSHECMGFSRLIENLNYSSNSLRAVWPSRFKSQAEADAYARKPEQIANKVYSGRMGNVNPGDGWRYRGRGCIQVTGRSNYTKLAQDTGLDVVNNPDILLNVKEAALCAAWYWNWRVGKGTIDETTKRINGGYTGIEDRRDLYEKALRVV